MTVCAQRENPISYGFNTVIAEEMHLWFEKNEKEMKLLAEKAFS